VVQSAITKAGNRIFSRQTTANFKGLYSFG